MRRLNATRVRDSSLAAVGFLRVAMTLVLVGFPWTSARAGETWDGGGANDNWTTGENWNLTGRDEFPPPNNGTADVRFAGNQGTSPNVDVPYSIRSLSFDSGSVSFFITGQELTIGVGGIVNMDNSNQFVSAPVRLAANNVWRSTAGLLYIDVVNLNGHSVLLQGGFPITLGDTISGAGDLTLIESFTSTATMQGSGSNTYTSVTEVQQGTLVLQKGGVAVPGDLIIRDGGVVRLAGDEQISQAAGNEVTVFSGGQLNVYDHTETLNRLVLDGGSAWATANGRITAAEAIVRGATGYWLNYGPVYVGDAANGTLEIAAGGNVSNAPGYIGNQAGTTGAVTVDGINSTWSIGVGGLYVGVDGNGTLDITNGGQVNSVTSIIGHGSGSTSTATVDGGGSRWSNSISLYVGYSGHGTLELLNSGDVFSDFGRIGHEPGSIGNVTIDGEGSRWNNTSDLHVGYLGDGTLTVRHGGIVTVGGDVHVGFGSASTGTFDVTQAIINVAGDTFVNAGDRINISSTNFEGRNLRVSGGSFMAENAGVELAEVAVFAGTITASDSVTITQSGKLDLGSGATLEVNSGARYELVNNNFLIARIGMQPGPAARVTVDGMGTVLAATSAFDVGYGGTGELRVTGGARVESQTGAVGSFQFGSAPSIGTLILDGTDSSGNPSSWLPAGGLNVGLSPTSEGSISILNGALLRSMGAITVGAEGRGNVLVNGRAASGSPSLMDVDSLWIAPATNSSGELTVSGGARIVTGHLVLGIGGAGTLTITDVASSLEQRGAAVITVADASNSMAVLNVRNGATLKTGAGPINVNPTGEVNLESGAVFDARGPINMNGGEFNFLGGTLHVDVFNGNLLNEGGTLAPGHSVGTTAVSGNYTQRSAAALEIEIADVFPGDWDVLTVGGNAILDGTLKVDLLDGFEPVIGNMFTIITTDVGNVGGQFDVGLFPVVNGLTFDVIYNPNSVVLQVIEATLPGDYNGNGVVDAADYVVWRKNDGTPTGYNTWRAHFGQTVGSGAGTGVSTNAAVPEPTSLVLLFLAAVAGLPRHLLR